MINLLHYEIVVTAPVETVILEPVSCDNVMLESISMAHDPDEDESVGNAVMDYVTVAPIDIVPRPKWHPHPRVDSNLRFNLFLVGEREHLEEHATPIAIVRSSISQETQNYFGIPFDAIGNRVANHFYRIAAEWERINPNSPDYQEVFEHELIITFAGELVLGDANDCTEWNIDIVPTRKIPVKSFRSTA